MAKTKNPETAQPKAPTPECVEIVEIIEAVRQIGSPAAVSVTLTIGGMSITTRIEF